MKNSIVIFVLSALVLSGGPVSRGEETPKIPGAFRVPACPFLGGVMVSLSPADIPGITEAGGSATSYSIIVDSPSVVLGYRFGSVDTKRVRAGESFSLSYPSSSKILILSERAPGKITITLGGRTFTIPVHAAQCPPNDEAVHAYYRTLFDQSAGTGLITRDPELYYRLTVLMNRHGGERKIELERRWTRSSKPEIVELFELTSGTLAIEQSLQINAGRDVSTGMTAEAQTIPVGDLAAPKLKTHDFNALMKGMSITIPETSRMVPHDALFLRFNTISAALRADDLSNAIREHAPIVTRHVAPADDTMLKILTHLALKKPDPFTRKFYGLAIGEMSVVLQDPYLLEGADLAFIMKIKNDTLFERQIKTYRDDFRAHYPGTTEESLQYKGMTITRFTSPGGEVRAHSFRNERYAVIATSLPFAKRIIDTIKKETRSAADNLDYRYLLGVHKTESGAFLYIGDDFVGRILSAPFKINELRRVNCEANMKLIRWAHNFRHIEKGSPSPLEDLVKEGYLSRTPLCPCGGEYVLEEGVPRCTRHGRLGQLRPLSDNEVTKVTGSEAGQYRIFVENYHRRWSNYIDPIGIAADIGDTVKLRTVILPLVEHTEYDMVNTIAGGPPVKFRSLSFAPNDTIFHAALKLRPFDGYRPDLSHLDDGRVRNEMLRAREGLKEEFPELKGDPYGWIGSEIDLFILDLKNREDAETIGTNRMEFEELPLDRVLARLSVTDLALAKDIFRRLLPRLEPDGILTEDSKLGGDLFEFKISRNLSVTLLLRKDGLWASGSAETLRDAVSRSCVIFRKSLGKRMGLDDGKSNFEAGIYPSLMKNLWPLVSRLIHRVYAIRCRQEMDRLETAILIHDPLAWTRGADLAGQTRLKQDWPPACPLGGTHSYEEGTLRCSVHGNAGNAVTKDLADRPSPLGKMLRDIKFFLTRLSFTPEGIDTEVMFKNPAD